MTHQNQLNKVWNTALRQIKETVEINGISFDCWLKPLRAAAMDDNTLYLSIDNEFAAKWIESHYRPLICRNLKKASAGRITQFRCIQDIAFEDLKTKLNEGNSVSAPEPEACALPDPAYTFDRIIVGEHNRSAYMTCLAVAEHPGVLGNPFCIQGAKGSGKTHLLHAIGNFILETQPGKTIRCVGAEKLNREWETACKEKITEKFHARYSACDVFILDDIQNILSQDEFQEELARIFTVLYKKDAQIIVSSTMPSYRIPKMRANLISLLIWGTVTEINPGETVGNRELP